MGPGSKHIFVIAQFNFNFLYWW